MGKLRLIEVGPRDGLQNQSRPVSLNVKQEYIRLLLAAGVREFEAGAFVRADRVPQMADSGRILTGFSDSELRGRTAYFLVPNEKGLDLALEAGVKSIGVFTAATDGFNLKNIGMNMKRSLEVLKVIVPRALRSGLRVRGYVSVVFGCPYDGRPRPKDVLTMTAKLLELGCFEVSLGDTIGVAVPKEVETTLKSILKVSPLRKIAGHFHDTRGMAIANIAASMDMGVRAFDSSSGGLGGCPFAPGATGNVATEDLLYLAEKSGFETGIDLEELARASRFIHSALGIMQVSCKTLRTIGERVE